MFGPAYSRKALSPKAAIGEARKIQRQLEKLNKRWGSPMPLNSGDRPTIRALYMRVGRLMNVLQNLEFYFSRRDRVIKQSSATRRFLGLSYSDLKAGKDDRAAAYLSQAVQYHNLVVSDLITEIKNPRSKW